MRILHIGDFHYKSGKNHQFDQKNIVEKLVDSLKSKKAVDMIVFTGDLVASGALLDDFKSANELLIDKIAKELNIKSENCFYSQGNHDINRNETSAAIINFFDSFNSSEDLDRVFREGSRDFISSLLPSSNYFDFIKQRFIGDEVHQLYTIHKRVIDGKRIGVLSINTAWLSSGLREDINQLQFPPSIIKNALHKMDGVDKKMLLLHHPLTNLKENNQVDLQHIVYSEFDLMFSGHTHRESMTTQFQGSNGIFWNTALASLTYDSNSEIGYSIIDYDLTDDSEVVIERGLYVKKENQFVNLRSVTVPISAGKEKSDQNKIRKKVFTKYGYELEVANELLLNRDDANPSSFENLFTAPVLTKNNDPEVNVSESDALFNYTDLINSDSNYLIFGKDKCGKSSLLKKIQLQLLKNYHTQSIVPFYIDYKVCEHSNHNDISKMITNYYQINNADTDRLLAENKLLLLVDNLNNNSIFHSTLIQFLEANPTVRFVACSDYVASRVYGEVIDNLSYERIFFKDLSRKEIRLYTDKHITNNKDDKEEVIERITKLCKEMQLPVNYWTVSLILLIYKKTNNDYTKNLFSILDLCVDEMLNKKGLTLSNTLKFEQYKELCSQIAHFLLTQHVDSVYGAKYEDIVQFIGKYIEKNPRIISETKEIFDYLLDTGILKKRGDGKYSFRLNGIFEYFLAFYIKENPEFKDEIIKTDSIYLSFNNELEIYSGFNRKDEIFLQLIFEKTRNVFDKIIKEKIVGDDVDKTLNLKVGEANDFANKIRLLKVNSPLKHETQDLIKDELQPIQTHSEVHLKPLYDTSDLNYESLEKYLSILSRVFKNSDAIENNDLVESIFNYIIDGFVALGIVLIDEVEGLAKKENFKHEKEVDEEYVIGEDMIRLISQFIPLLTQVNIYEGIGHINMQKIIRKKIEEYKKDAKNNQFKLFILYFILMDIDIKANKDLIDDVFSLINMPMLKVSTYFKLNYYLAFKGYKNVQLEQFFKNKIQKAQMRLDNKTDVNSMQRGLAVKSQRNIIRSGQDK